MVEWPISSRNSGFGVTVGPRNGSRVCAPKIMSSSIAHRSDYPREEHLQR